MAGLLAVRIYRQSCLDHLTQSGRARAILEEEASFGEFWGADTYPDVR